MSKKAMPNQKLIVAGRSSVEAIATLTAQPSLRSLASKHHSLRALPSKKLGRLASTGVQEQGR